MIDIHCHILPGIDDGSPDLPTSVEMARMAVADGIVTIVCTPHFTPGIYNNTGSIVSAAVADFAGELDRLGIELTLAAGADAHATPDLLANLRSNRVLSLGGSRYFLLEPSHNVLPPRFEEFAFALISGGFVPTSSIGSMGVHCAHPFIRRAPFFTVGKARDNGPKVMATGYWSRDPLDRSKVQSTTTTANRCLGGCNPKSATLAARLRFSLTPRRRAWG